MNVKLRKQAKAAVKLIANASRTRKAEREANRKMHSAREVFARNVTSGLLKDVIQVGTWSAGGGPSSFYQTVKALPESFRLACQILGGYCDIVIPVKVGLDEANLRLRAERSSSKKQSWIYVDIVRAFGKRPTDKQVIKAAKMRITSNEAVKRLDDRIGKLERAVHNLNTRLKTSLVERDKLQTFTADFMVSRLMASNSKAWGQWLQEFVKAIDAQLTSKHRLSGRQMFVLRENFFKLCT